MKSFNMRIQRHISKDFAKMLDDIKITRIKLGKETLNPVADWRITLAIFRHPLIQKIKQDIIQAKLK